MKGDIEKEILKAFVPIVSELRVLRALYREVSVYLGDPGMTSMEALMEIKRRTDAKGSSSSTESASGELRTQQGSEASPCPFDD